MEPEFYEEIYAAEDHYWWFVARRSILKKILDQCYQRQESGRVLEVGCGSGGNLSLLEAYGRLSAMELDDGARTLAASRNICPVRPGRLPDEIPYDYSFDLICMLDVLEHIDDDLAALRTVVKQLNGNGTLLLTVPAYRFLWGPHDVVNHHKRRYTIKGLTKVSAEAGLKVRYVSYFNTFLFPVIAASRILDNIRQRDSSGLKLPPEPVNRFLTVVFAGERLFLPKLSFPFGISIVLVAGKA
jgi:SAM-dependent methyltransferase